MCKKEKTQVAEELIFLLQLFVGLSPERCWALWPRSRKAHEQMLNLKHVSIPMKSVSTPIEVNGTTYIPDSSYASS